MLLVYRENKDGLIIKGIGLPAFIHNGDYFQTIIQIYEDGMIDCWGLVNLEEFKKKVAQGRVVTQVPDQARISCHHLYYGLSNLEYYINIDDFIKEVEDTINRLQNKKTTADICLEAFTRFLKEQTDENKIGLQKSYENVPKHLRRYLLGDMDTKDSAIRHCIENKNISNESIEAYKEYYDYL